MSMNTKECNLWDDLPNARHIDAIIVSVKENTDEWATDTRPAIDYLLSEDPAWQIGCHELKNAQRELEWYAAWENLYVASYGLKIKTISHPRFIQELKKVLMGLVAYDDCGHMLDSDPREIELLAKLGDNKAALILPACKVFAGGMQSKKC